MSNQVRVGKTELSGLSARSEKVGAKGQLDPASLETARAFEKRGFIVAQSLSGRFAWRTVIWFLGVLVGVGVVAALTISGRLSYWVATPINSILIYFIFAPLHEAVHDNIAGANNRFRLLELIIGHISGFVLLAPYPGFRQLHLHHHQHTNDPVEDPDYWVRSNNYFVVVLRCLLIQPVYILHLYKIARDPVGMRAFVFEMVYVVSYVVIIAVAYALGWGPQLMLLWILPGYIGVVICPLMFDWPVHHPHKERGRYRNSAILLFPRPIRYVMEIAFLGHSYHLMHHLFPRIPFYHYGTAYFALQSDLAGVDGKVRDFTASPPA